MDDLLLREICRLTDVSRRAIQGYEKEGLVMPCGKNKYGYLNCGIIKVKRSGQPDLLLFLFQDFNIKIEYYITYFAR